MADQSCRICSQTFELTKDNFYWVGKRFTYECKNCLKHQNRTVHLMAWYGLTREDLAELMTFQENCCAICDRAFTESGETKMSIDHEHHGRTRGLLCNRCNAVMGRMGDDAELLKKMVRYLALPPADEIWDEDRVGTSQREKRASYYRGRGGYQRSESVG